MSIRKKFELEAKNTVGYAEADNKASFMTGVSVALLLAEKHYENEIENLKRQLDGYKGANETLITDLRTVSTIINRYSDNN